MSKTNLYAETLVDYVDTSIRESIFGFATNNKLWLNGGSGPGGGSGTPPGGIVGQLIQKRVTFDTTESGSMCIVGSASLLDNLNRIRWWQKPARWFEASPQNPRSMKIEIGSGIWYYDENLLLDFPGGTSPTITHPAANPRIDVIYVTESGTIGVQEGSEAVNPVITMPTASGVLPIWAVYATPLMSGIGWPCETYSGYLYEDIRPFIAYPGGGGAGLWGDGGTYLYPLDSESVQLVSGAWIGLGNTKGHIEFHDLPTDEIRILDCNFIADGHGAIGANSVISTHDVLAVQETTTMLAGTFNGCTSVINFVPGANFDTTVHGIYSKVTLSGAYARTDGALIGGNFITEVSNSIAATDLIVEGIRASVDTEDANSDYASAAHLITPEVDTGVCSLGFGLRITQGAVGAGSITALYGIYIDNIDAGTTNYAIYCANGEVYFKDHLYIGANSNIKPINASGQNLGDATHLWDVFASYADLVDTGWIGNAVDDMRIIFNESDDIEIQTDGANIYSFDRDISGSTPMTATAANIRVVGGDNTTGDDAGICFRNEKTNADWSIFTDESENDHLTFAHDNEIAAWFNAAESLIMASGNSIKPENATGQNLGSSANRWDLYASDINMDNGGVIHCTTLGGPIITFNSITDLIGFTECRVGLGHNTPVVILDIDSPDLNYNGILLGSGTPAGILGMIKFTGLDFFGYTPSGWMSLTASGGGGGGGVGNHNILSAVHTDTLTANVSRGSIIVGNSTPLWSELTVGAANSVLTADGTDVAWSTMPTLIRIGIGAAIADQDATISFAETNDPTQAANEGRLYCKDDGVGNTELYYMDESGNVSKLTPPSGAPTDAQYIVMALNATLTDERVLTAGNGIALADGGAGGNATISLDNHAHAGVAGDGGQLDWDNVWSDAVHDHSAAGEGGATLGFTAMTGAGVTVPDGWFLGIGAALERIEFNAAGDIQILGANVGIGTAAPGYKLEVNGDIAIASGETLLFTPAAGTGAYSIHYANVAPNYPIRFVGSRDPGNHRYFEFGYYTGDDQANAWNPGVVINSYNGNVGIGTAAPTRKLMIKDTYHMGVEIHTTGMKWIATNAANNAEAPFGIQGSVIDLLTNGVVRAQVGNSGNVGIGTSAPGNPRLAVEGNVADALVTIFNDGNSNNREGMIMQCGADVNPSVIFIAFQDGDGGALGEIYGDGAGGVTYGSSSDSRIKKEVAGYSDKAIIEMIHNLKPRRYIGKKTMGDGTVKLGEKKNYGFFAQEMREYIPSVVGENKEGRLSIGYGKLTPYLWRMIQILEDKIMKLEERK